MKWPFAVTGAGLVAVIAAIIVNHVSSPNAVPDPQAGILPTAHAPDVPRAEHPDVSVSSDRAPLFDLVRVAPDGHAVIAGQAEPGSVVVILDGERALGEVVADARGDWVFLPQAPLQPGEHWLGLEARPHDRTAVLSDDLMIVVIPEPGEDISGRTAEWRDQPLAIKVSRSGFGPATVLQKPGGSATPPVLSIDAIDRDPAGRVTLSGSAPRDALVNIYLDNMLAGQAVTDASGRWLLRRDSLHVHKLTVRADQIDADGNVLASVSVPLGMGEAVAMAVVRDPESVDRPTTYIEVEAGQNLWRIAREVYGTGQAYTIIYEANRNAIENPDLIFPGQVFSLPEL